MAAANAAERAAIAAGAKGAAAGLAPHYPAVQGQDLRGFGWDIDTAFSRPRGVVFPIGSFGHTGFTGTSLWMDPGSDTYVILLANAIHPRGNPPISNLRGEVATAAAEALGLYGSSGAMRPWAQRSSATMTGIDVLGARARFTGRWSERHFSGTADHRDLRVGVADESDGAGSCGAADGGYSCDGSAEGGAGG